jgi:hypothetical protein
MYPSLLAAFSQDQAAKYCTDAFTLNPMKMIEEDKETLII